MRSGVMVIVPTPINMRYYIRSLYPIFMARKFEDATITIIPRWFRFVL